MDQLSIVDRILENLNSGFYTHESNKDLMTGFYFEPEINKYPHLPSIYGEINQETGKIEINLETKNKDFKDLYKDCIDTKYLDNLISKTDEGVYILDKHYTGEYLNTVILKVYSEIIS